MKTNSRPGEYPNNLMFMTYGCETEERLKEGCGVDILCYPEIIKDVIEAVISSILTPRQYGIIHDRYEAHLSQGDIARKLYLSSGRVHQVEKDAIKKMRDIRWELRDIIVSINNNSDIRNAVYRYVTMCDSRVNGIIQSLTDTHYDALKLIVSDKFVQVLLNMDVDGIISVMSDTDPNIIDLIIKNHTGMKRKISSSDRIKRLGLSKRAHTALTRRGYVYIYDILKLSKDDLLKIQNVGIGITNEIIQCVEKAGFTLQ